MAEQKIKEHPILFSAPMVRAILDGRKSQTRRTKDKNAKVGDRLWVKETWQSGDYAKNDPRGAVYRATDPDWETMEGWKWKPSIFMPRWASRITLEVTAVRVQRLQEISPEDAIAEGVTLTQGDYNRDDLTGCWTDYSGKEFYWRSPVDSFHSLWDSINGKTAPWASNPWVWVYSFERVK